jgi:hypothetical protein
MIIKRKNMKLSILTTAAIMVLLAATMNIGAQPGHSYKGGNVLEYGNVLYRPVNNEMGVQIRVAGFIGSIFVAI